MVVVMYVRRSTITPKIIERIQRVTGWFSTIEEELQEVDISANYALQTQIQHETEFSGYPVFYLDHLKPIGGIEELHKWYLNYKLQYAHELIEEENSFEIIEGPNAEITEDASVVSNGYIGGTLDTLEWLVRGSSTLFSPSSWFSWGASDANAKKDHMIEFPVVQTNWYWRQQKRILRFTEEKIVKIHPITKEIRSERAYTTLESLVVTNGVFLNFTFLEDLLRKVNEYYQVSPAVINNLIEVLLDKLPKLPIRYDTE